MKWIVAGGALALGAQLAPLDGRFATHMLQHLLLGDLAPLLIAIGLRRGAPPIPALAGWTAALVAWHVAPVYDAALRHEGLHLLQHASFLAAGIAIWSALLAPGPAWFTTGWRLPYVLVMWGVSLTLSQVFMWSGGSYYAGYTVEDQRAGGGVMLVEGSIVMLGIVAWLLLREFRESD